MKNVYAHVDLTLLKATARLSDFISLCETAKRFDVASVCVPSYHVKRVSDFLFGTGIATCTVVGFPLGNSSTETKVYEATEAIKNGATEIDMVANIGSILDGNWFDVSKDIAAVKKSLDDIKPSRYILKVIVETCYLDAAHIVKMCEICEELGVDYIKTSTGFGTEGAKLEDVRLMKKVIDENGYKLKIKASGGIREMRDAEEFIRSGADRIGTSGLKT